MNITELARRLRITPNELREYLPRMGFHIGFKAIKVDNKTAHKIMKEWPSFREKLRIEKEKAEKEEEKTEKEKVLKKIQIPKLITVRDFAEVAQIPVNKVLSELMKNGIFTSINEKIDIDTAMIIGENLDVEVLEKEDQEEEAGSEEGKINKVLEKESQDKLQERAPVIVVMGHVDHGKTKLLDTIRKTNVVAGEHGGITQHIGAYQIERNDRSITFIDTPGHEAFTAMRSRGAKIADVAILVVAADDGVKPQTVEAYKIIQAAGIPFIVAINKMDKEGADINRVKQELSTQLNIIPEDWGGKIVCVPISALKGEGIEDILDTILLLTDTEAKNMKANPESQAIGTVIESHVDKNSGPVATILVQNGTLKIGDQLCLQEKMIGKARSLKDYNGQDIEAATPSTPVKIIGLKIAPTVGDIIEVGEGERIKGKFKMVKRQTTLPAQTQESDSDNIKHFNIIIKSDVLGSAEAVEESLMKINTEEVKVKIVNKGLGNIIEGDIDRAEAANAEIVGFNVKVNPAAETLLREKDVKVHTFNIIYDLIAYVREEMQKLVTPKFERIDLGRLKVLAIFKTGDSDQIVGGKVLDGTIKASKVEIYRDKELITTGEVEKIQSGKEDVNEASKDQECGISFKGNPVIQEGDIINFYENKEIINKL
ncbi:translation initiation factor IF-2 [Candidatus Falkowbacteria bacterium]|nr:translation initiation factor IF-2 [Candidatus Falkowbacteria bacterium]